MMNVNGTMRRLQPVCAQALPWSTSFIGCPGIRCAADEDFTLLFKVGPAYAVFQGTSNGGQRRANLRP
jgi:hypothetical protein